MRVLNGFKVAVSEQSGLLFVNLNPTVVATSDGHSRKI